MELTKTVKLHLVKPDTSISLAFQKLTEVYRDACNFVSDYIFHHDMCLVLVRLHDALYYTIREKFQLKAQLTQSVIKTVIARYQSIRTQMKENPWRYKDKNGDWHSIPRTLDWLTKPVSFSSPQADLVYHRDYSFPKTPQTISVATMEDRAKLQYILPDYYKCYFDGTWKFGTAKLLFVRGEWYLHVSVTKEVEDVDDFKTVVGNDRGLRFLCATYDGNKSMFVSGEEVMKKQKTFRKVRSELQRRGTHSAKRRLKKMSGRENRWMTDVNHRLSKALVQEYGSAALHVLENLTGVSFDERNMSSSKEANAQLRSWAFYQLEQFLVYKAKEAGSMVLKVPADYTSQRCPKCGRIHKENRHRETHEYICDQCGYRSNDDRIGAMNLYELGLRYLNGEESPKIQKPKDAKETLPAGHPQEPRKA